MRRTATRVSLVLLATVSLTNVARGQHPHEHELQIPEALQHEHQEVEAALRLATETPGEVGAAAREVERLLRPHFRREEEIALRPLGLLPQLVRNEPIRVPDWLLPMTDSLRAELPEMMDDHKVVHHAVQKLGQAATTAGDARAVQVAQRLARHARAEEEIYYPMAVLIGEVVQYRSSKGRSSKGH